MYKFREKEILWIYIQCFNRNMLSYRKNILTFRKKKRKNLLINKTFSTMTNFSISSSNSTINPNLVAYVFYSTISLCLFSYLSSNAFDFKFKTPQRNETLIFLIRASLIQVKKENNFACFIVQVI